MNKVIVVTLVIEGAIVLSAGGTAVLEGAAKGALSQQASDNQVDP